MMSESATFWETKLDAFVHDTPSKATDIARHYERAAAARARTGLSEEAGFDHTADHAAAAADRIPFPFRQIRCNFDGGATNPFRHPLDGTQTQVFKKPFDPVALAEETEQVTQPNAFAMPQDWDATLRARGDFFSHWRLWQRHAIKKDERFAFIPADTRIPDHTIWNHLNVTAAMATAGTAAAFLKFHIGPVQSFIAAARSTRDLWSGSFLISWLMMTGMKRLSEWVGPDAVIFPNLYDQPLFDVMWKRELWDNIRAADGSRTVWEAFTHTPEALTTPNSPNVFLALVPAGQAADIARAVEIAIRKEWKCIGEAVLASVSGVDAKLFRAQVDAHWTLSWQTTPWPRTLDEAERLCSPLPDRNSVSQFQAFRRFFEQEMPVGHRDRRYYTDDSKTQLSNVAAAWPLLVALNAWQLNATRATTAFLPWPGAAQRLKDALNGREEMVTDGAGVADWGKHPESAGATTLIKRLWHKAYLRQEWADVFLRDGYFSMPNTVSIAGDQSSYFAILAMDGDDMGKWISGAKTPPLHTQLAPAAKAYFERMPGFPELKRPLNPSYHLHISQALSNFALHVAPDMVREYGGRLLYAGGDDVLAMLPAIRALTCADALQKAFAKYFGSNGLVLPGCHASIGLALCHEKAPLQDAVRAAHDAQQRAKAIEGKHAFAVSVFKRSGEISEWKGRFERGNAIAALQAIVKGMSKEIISAKFPHRLLELIEPFYSTGAEDVDGFPVKEAFRSDLALAISRQHGQNWTAVNGEAIQQAIEAYLDDLKGKTTDILRDMSGLLTVAAFLARQDDVPIATGNPS